MREVFDMYKKFLTSEKQNDINSSFSEVNETIINGIEHSPLYDSNSLVNNIKHPLSITRKKNNKATFISKKKISTGDLIDSKNELWLCITSYIDEYNISRGEMMLCNYVFKIQDADGIIINKPAVVDNGSYIKNDKQSIPVLNAKYVCYVPLDKDSKYFHIDKRLALGKVFDSKQDEVLNVGKISWLDSQTNNYDKDSHLLVFGINDDMYVKERDNLDLMICDYMVQNLNQNAEDIHNNTGVPRLGIKGKDNIRLGTKRTYSAFINEENNDINNIVDVANLRWSIDKQIAGVTIINETNSNCCKLIVDYNPDLLGESFNLVCEDATSKYLNAYKKVVITVD